jgi:hypothetical protein
MGVNGYPLMVLSSLQATWIRNTVGRALRDSNAGPKTVPADLVYMRPTILSLSQFVNHTTNSQEDDAEERARKTAEMLALVEKYSTSFPSFRGTGETCSVSEGLVVLVTGTTGGLGASVLAELVVSPIVHKVYALNRRSTKGESLHVRQRNALATRGLDGDIVNSKKISLVESDLTLVTLGLDTTLLEQVRLSSVYVRTSLSKFPRVADSRNNNHYRPYR